MHMVALAGTLCQWGMLTGFHTVNVMAVCRECMRRTHAHAETVPTRSLSPLLQQAAASQWLVDISVIAWQE